MDKTCQHKWRIIKIEEGIEKSLFWGKKSKARVYILQCLKCGDIKQRWVNLPDDN